jgi:hypothetical protein
MNSHVILFSTHKSFRQKIGINVPLCDAQWLRHIFLFCQARALISTRSALFFGAVK